jgi:hypothetical protein
MRIVINSRGVVRCVYGESIDLSVIGSMSIERASHVEPDDQSRWWADLVPVGGPILGPFPRRSEALASEQQWLETHWLTAGGIAHDS